MSATTETREEDAAAVWGAERHMNGLEAMMWRAEADPRLRSTILAVEILDQVPEWERLLAAHDWATRMVPRFRQKVFEPLLGLGAPTWVVDEDFDLHYHVRRVALPDGAGLSEVFRLAEQFAMTAFDRARSPWEAMLVEGLPDGRAAYLLKLHHSTTDGLGAVQLLSGLHSRQREHDRSKPQPQPPPPERASETQALWAQASRDAAGLARALQAGTARAVGVAGAPGRSLRDALRFGSSLRRVMADPDAEGSPLLRERSLSWRFLAMDVAFADLRGAGKAAGGSLNDAYVAALLGAFRRYHEELGQPIEVMPMAMPVSVRREGDSAGGNRFAGARFAGPVGIVDPAKRIRAVGELVRSFRSEPALDGLGILAPALARLPGPMIARLAGGLTKGNDLQASNVPGIREDVYVAGGRVERSYPFGPLPGTAAMITLVSHGDGCCIGANVDPAAITDLEGFGACLVDGFAEVLALAPHDAAPPVLHT